MKPEESFNKVTSIETGLGNEVDSQDYIEDYAIQVLSAQNSVYEDLPQRLFLGCLPSNIGEEELLSIFEPYGTVQELFIVREEDQESSLGFAYLRYSNVEESDTCIRSLNRLFYCGGMKVPMQVRYIEEMDQYSDNKVFVGGLPLDASHDELFSHMARTYGPVFSVQILKKNHLSTSAAFIKFLFKSSSDLLISDSLSRSVYLPNGEVCESIRADYAHQSTTSNTSSLSFPATSVSRDNAANSNLHVPYGSLQNQKVLKFSLPEDFEEEEVHPMKLFVGCLPYSRNPSEISLVFQKYGPLLEVALLTDTEGRSRGAAFVTFVKRDDAINAMKNLNHYIFKNSTRPINVSLAHNQSYYSVISHPKQIQSPSSPSSSAAAFCLVPGYVGYYYGTDSGTIARNLIDYDLQGGIILANNSDNHDELGEAGVAELVD